MNIPDDIDELAALYAAGALTPEECRAVEDQARRCSKTAEALQLYEPVLLGLAAAVPAVTPDPRVRAAVLQAIARPPAVVIRKAAGATWDETGIPGVRRRMLFTDHQRRQVTLLLRLDAGAVFPGHPHAGAEEIYVLEGDLDTGEQLLQAGDYQYSPPGSHHGAQRSPSGCVALVIAPLTEKAGAH